MSNFGIAGAFIAGLSVAYVSIIIAFAVVTIGAPETPKENK